MGTTNYVNTFIAVSPDCSVPVATPPPARNSPSIAERTLELLQDRPYELTSDDVIFTVWAERQGIPEDQWPAVREAFFARGRACLRASELGKRYGWGTHHDERSRVAVYGLGSEDYRTFVEGRRTAPDGTPVQVLAAMRSRR